jgi:hypothetical protein
MENMDVKGIIFILEIFFAFFQSEFIITRIGHLPLFLSR